MRGGIAGTARPEGYAKLPVERDSHGRDTKQLRKVVKRVVSLVHGHLPVILVRPVAELHATETELVHEILGPHVTTMPIVLA